MFIGVNNSVGISREFFAFATDPMSAEEALLSMINHEPAYLKWLGWLLPVTILSLVGLGLYFLIKHFTKKPDPEPKKSGCSLCR